VYIRASVSGPDSPSATERRCALLDPFGGLAGDMLLGALLDLDPGLEAALREPLGSLGLPGWQLDAAPAMRRQLGCVKATFSVPDEADHRHLGEIRQRIDASTLPARAKHQADAAFVLLAEAEAKVHRISIERVHFHEVGAADAILDICAVSFALDRLGVTELLCGPLPGGSGMIRCAHGDMPSPAPAVVHLLEDFVVQAGVGEGEMVTPTGAALLRAWGRPLEAGELGYRTRAVGYGAGTRASSILRLTIVEAVEAPRVGGHQRDWVYALETHLDDESPELLGWVSEQLFELGALDVAFTPLTMKKGRPGVALTVLVPPALRERAVAAILRETTALGVREQLLARTTLAREITTLDTPWGPVRIKRAGGRDRPEYEDLARIARARALPLREVADAVARLLADQAEG
jgi:pyridinium-3,5-bisthiocarboxylic acid mononucleotide nickel chelatase